MFLQSCIVHMFLQHSFLLSFLPLERADTHRPRLTSQPGGVETSVISITFSTVGPSPFGASSAFHKEGCLVAQGAFESCCCLRSATSDCTSELPVCRVGTATPSVIKHLSVCPLSVAVGLSFPPVHISLKVKIRLCTQTILTL